MFIKLEEGVLYDTDFTVEIYWNWLIKSNEIYFDGLLNAIYHEYELRKINPIPSLIKMYSIYTEFRPHANEENAAHFCNFFKKKGLNHYLVLL